jgi:recombination protein RecA
MGAYFSYGELRIGQGRENAKEYLRQNPALAQELEAQIRAAGSAPPAVAAFVSDEAPVE